MNISYTVRHGSLQMRAGGDKHSLAAFELYNDCRVSDAVRCLVSDACYARTAMKWCGSSRQQR